jgi:fusaric acid resistance family protein
MMRPIALALTFFVGCAVGALSFRVLPPLPPTLRTRRLLALSLRDLRRLAIDPLPSSVEWESRIDSRLAAMPDKTEPLQRAQLLAALSVGAEIIQLRQMSARPSLAAELDAALTALARGDSAKTRSQLAQIEHRLAALSDADPDVHCALRARASIVAISEALAEHAAYFGAAQPGHSRSRSKGLHPW